MASSYSDLKIELIGTGEQSGSWGTTTNTNLGTAIEEAIAESVDVPFLKWYRHSYFNKFKCYTISSSFKT